MSPVIRIICILFGQDRSFTAKGIARKSFGISCRRICSRCMIPPEDRDMKFGIENMVNRKATDKDTLSAVIHGMLVSVSCH